MVNGALALHWVAEDSILIGLDNRDRVLLQDDGRRFLDGFDFIFVCPVVVDP
jgi:hypothetical protein